MNRLLVFGLWLLSLSSFAQEDRVVLNRQREFHTTIPAGNYSGITRLEGNRYAVVNDKAQESGFHLFLIDIDSITGKILHAREEGFRSSGIANRDDEGIAFFALDSTIFITGENDNEALEYTLDGILTGRKLQMPDIYKQAKDNKGLEALTYQQQTGQFYTVPEKPLKGDSLLRIQSFGNDLKPSCRWFYQIDRPSNTQKKGRHTKGVPALTALPDGRLLVMEREIFSPKKHIGSWVKICIYVVTPTKETAGHLLDKELLVSFETRINLTARSFANYEGMCLGPRLADGRHLLLLISDSQKQYKGYLKDWIKTIVF